MNERRLSIPHSRLTVVELLQLFGDVTHYPMEVWVDGEAHLAQQCDVYNMLLRDVPFSLEADLFLALSRRRTGETVEEPSGGLVVVDSRNVYMKQGEIWYPHRFEFVASERNPCPRTKAGHVLEMDVPLRWGTLVRFLRTFYPHRRKFSIYRQQTFPGNFFSHLRSLYMEFKTVPSNELEILEDGRKTNPRVADELARRRVLSSLV